MLESLTQGNRTFFKPSQLHIASFSFLLEELSGLLLLVAVDQDPKARVSWSRLDRLDTN